MTSVGLRLNPGWPLHGHAGRADPPESEDAELVLGQADAVGPAGLLEHLPLLLGHAEGVLLVSLVRHSPSLLGGTTCWLDGVT